MHSADHRSAEWEWSWCWARFSPAATARARAVTHQVDLGRSWSWRLRFDPRDDDDQFPWALEMGPWWREDDMDELEIHGNEDLYDEQAADEARETAEVESQTQEQSEQRVRAECPHCGSTNLGTNEDLSGTAQLQDDAIWLVGDPEDPTEEYEFGGYTEVHWDSSSTQGYACRSCYSNIDYGELVPAGTKEKKEAGDGTDEADV